MPISAQSIILRASVALQDPEGVRWSAKELVRHLNDGQRELVRLRPDSAAVNAILPLAAGFAQHLPPQYYTLIDVPNNASGRRRRITKVDLLQLDAVEPTWRNRSPADEVIHFMHDLRDPRAFYVYPPVSAGVTVDLVAAAYPTDVPEPTGDSFSLVAGSSVLGLEWSEALLNFVLYKAYSKDAEYGGNAQLAAGYLGLFNAAIGSQLQSAALAAPKT